jgi:GxxExxY protein
MDLSNIENDIDFQMSPKNPIHSDIDNIDNILNLIDNDTDNQSMISFIINICNNVFNSLGKGFNECIYHKAILVDLYKTEYQIETKKIIPIDYKGVNVGYVESDIIIYDEKKNIMIIIELKAQTNDLSYKEKFQVQKYMNNIANENTIGLVINFSQKNNTIYEVQSDIVYK